MSQNDYDVIIVGTGAGGGTIAKELAPLCAKGLRVALLEWGDQIPKSENTRNEIEMAKKYYFEMGGFQTESKDLTLAFAKGVGGSTNVYTGTSLVIPKRVIDESWRIAGITHEDLLPRFQKYIAENSVHLLPEEELNVNNQLFREGCKRLGWKHAQFPVNLKDCKGLATCNLGCANHAKQGTARVQIPAAVSQGVELRTGIKVLRIVGKTLEAEDRNGLRLTFRADKIILAAGAINTPAILHRSPEFQNQPSLGRYFTCHPAMILVGRNAQAVNSFEGHPKSFYCDEFLETKKFLLETCHYFPFTLSKSLSGYGQAVQDFISHYAQLQMILSLAVDEAQSGNRVSVDSNGNPRVHYRFSENTIRALSDASKAAAEIFFATGATQVHAPSASQDFIEPHQLHLIRPEYFQLGKVSISAAHLMGGCRMGHDPATSVTNDWGQIHGQSTVYVADASLFPAASEVNPYLTIMALADRVAEGISKQLGG